jgi:hypothetical protein
VASPPNDVRRLRDVSLRCPAPFGCQFLQQYTPPFAEHVPEPVEHEYLASAQIASGAPITLFTHDAVGGSVASHTG